MPITTLCRSVNPEASRTSSIGKAASSRLRSRALRDRREREHLVNRNLERGLSPLSLIWNGSAPSFSNNSTTS